MRQLLLYYFLIFSALDARAAIIGAQAKAPHIDAEILSETQSLQPGKEAWMGINLTMEPSWHTYWQFPGDTGLATKIEWKLPPGFKASEIFWPAPEKFLLSNLVNYGYSGEVLLLTRLQVPQSFSKDVANISAKVHWLACKQECIPGSVEMNLQMSVTRNAPLLNQFTRITFEKTRNQLPVEWPAGAVDIQGDEEFFYLRLPQFSKLMPKYSSVEFIPASAGMMQATAEQKVKSWNASLVLQVSKDKNFLDKKINGVVIVKPLDGKNTYPILVNSKISSTAVSAELKKLFSSEYSSFWQMLLFAFFGGLLLNLMPCVLPVLGMKILSILQKNSMERKKAQESAWIYTFGVLVSFWSLSAILFFLRASGEQLGWGFQLQSPLFLLFLLHLFLLVAFHLLGKIQFGESIVGVGTSLASKDGAAGSFFTGVLAVVVASPCTAPFMGVALGAALLLPFARAFLIFSALGMGLAFPFLFFTYFPAAMKVLPRPGIWMDHLKKLLSLPIFATVLWLLWVYSQQVSMLALGLTSAALVLISLVIFWRQRVALFLTVASLLMGIISIHFAPLVGIPMKKEASSAGAIPWENFSVDALAEARKAGRTIFIDFTAAWCLTCQVNERLVLGQESIVKLFKEKNILAMRADWTNADPEITKMLEGYGRAGVPLYVLYKSGKEAEILPQVLSVDSLEQVLQ